MNVTKRTFSYGIKLSKDYNSVSVTEGFEMEGNDEDFEMACGDVVRNVVETAEEHINKLGKKPRNLLQK